MAKTGVVEGDPITVATAKAATELKRELQRLVKAILSEDDINVDAIDKTHQTLFALKDLKLKRQSSFRTSTDSARVLPDEFRCPLSKELMRDPVIVSTGQTYDRPFIQKWLKAGNRTCPRTQQVLSQTILTPNHLIREMISQWCKNNGIQMPDPVQYLNDEGLTEADRDLFFSLLEKMSSILSDQKVAARELRLLTKKMPSFRALFGESADAIPQLLRPLSRSNSGVHPNLQEDIITTLLNLSIHDNNKKLVAETPMVVPLLIDALRSGTIETRSNAAAALFTLSALDSNKELIGKSGALKPLVELLDEGNPVAMKDVASAIFSLCIIHDNKARAVRDGAVRVILKKIMNNVHVDELLAILAMLSTNQKAIEEMGDLGAVPCLLNIIRETSCARSKENCIAILYTICYSDRSKWKIIRDDEKTYGTISQLTENGTARAKRKANGILDRLNRAVNLTHTA
ncbi:PREDICTED: U-box domain-containing protein 9 [Nicotiana attenuata]|uniref:RING-type E3 ubiquitin transferase n=1 Tax=Nicotiana attenuata TaxID=49451 RepID=A0A1J6KZA6_NICAT|nr:PREDICTED: U-box domain-containing protein 9 [Nicotiana attenuata]OIT28003.1 u-box domain-containing protein 9 [Nicotiana attenuata]